MLKVARPVLICLLTAVTGVTYAGQVSAPAGAASSKRFEVNSIKAVRPALVNTVAALKKGDIAGARDAFEAYDSGWNGVEVYINVRDKDLYGVLEQNYQSRIAKGLSSPKPDTAALLADAQAMLAKYDEAIGMIEKAAPLNPLYDDVARLRIVRANLRDVTPALKSGNIAKARKAFTAFDDKWDSIEDLIKAKSSDAYTDIEKGMIQIERALMPDKPDVDQATALVKDVMDKYNAVVADITKDARGPVADAEIETTRWMERSDRKGDGLERLRRWLLGVLVFGLVGTEAELLLLKHYEDPWQFVPLVLIALAIAVLVWHTNRYDAASLRTLRIIMLLFLIAGFAGFALHFRGAVAFQLETDPAIGKWELTKKVMRIKAPPVLAPGVMLQLGLIGLAYALSNSRDRRSEIP